MDTEQIRDALQLLAYVMNHVKRRLDGIRRFEAQQKQQLLQQFYHGARGELSKEESISGSPAEIQEVLSLLHEEVRKDACKRSSGCQQLNDIDDIPR